MCFLCYSSVSFPAEMSAQHIWLLGVPDNDTSATLEVEVKESRKTDTPYSIKTVK
jgi:hypothetical protein